MGLYLLTPYTPSFIIPILPPAIFLTCFVCVTALSKARGQLQTSSRGHLSNPPVSSHSLPTTPPLSQEGDLEQRSQRGLPGDLTLFPFCAWCAGPVTEGTTKKLRSNIRRSTETGIAVEMRSRVTRQGSRESTDGSTNSNSSEGTCVQPTPPWTLPPRSCSHRARAEGERSPVGFPNWRTSTQMSVFLCPYLPPSPPLDIRCWGPQSAHCCFSHPNTPVA